MSALVSTRLFVMLASLASLIACGDPSARWEVGGLYSVSDGGEFDVVKILALDPDAVSLRIYRERFPTRPEPSGLGALSLGSIEDPDGFGIGHLPVAPRDFALWFPVHLRTEPVSPEELEGYQIWKEAGGGAVDFGLLSEAALESEGQE